MDSPTAMQAAAEEHETLSGKLSALLGMRWIVHLRPSQLSTGRPTAMQARPEVQETPVSPLSASAIKEFAVGWIRQAWPFQRSANVTSWSTVSQESPTATHARADTHETASSSLVLHPEHGFLARV
jgi:hypothetical protein